MYTAADGTTLDVPEVPGLGASLAAGKVTYAAMANNSYGLKVGAYAGEFKPNLVIVETDGRRRQTGVVVLDGHVATKLTKVAHDAGLFRLALPVDLRAIANEEEVQLTADVGLVGEPRVSMAVPEDFKIVEYNPYNMGIRLYTSLDPATVAIVSYEISDYGHPEAPTGEVARGQELMYVGVYGDSDLVSPVKNVRSSQPLEVGSLMATASAGRVSIACYTATLVSTAMSTDNLLQTSNGTPMAIAAR